VVQEMKVITGFNLTRCTKFMLTVDHLLFVPGLQRCNDN